LEFAPSAVESGALVIDNSSAFRLKEGVPLVVPSCNMEDAKNHSGIIANPNCSTIQMVEALKPICAATEIKRVIVSTYQAVSGSGMKAINEFQQQIKDYNHQKELKSDVYPFPILMNAIPQVDVFLEKGYTKEEMKMVWETRKILHAPQMKIVATCVRIPVLRSHSESILIETEKKITAQFAVELWKKAGIKVMNETREGGYPTPREMIESLDTYVGRVREDLSFENGLCFWCVADQLYKGAAWNALEIAEKYFF
jgi:aspartate-semialdehyde dehydrogenase